MDKCLVTKLKGTAVADLPFFDAIRMRIVWGTETSFPIKSGTGLGSLYFGGNGVTIKVIRNGSIRLSGETVGDEYTITSSTTQTIDIIPSDPAQDTQFVLKGIANISTWGRNTSSPYKMVYSDDLPLLAGSGITSTIFALLAGDTEPCDISVLSELPNKSLITTILINDANNSYKGDISNLRAVSGLLDTGIILSAFNSGIYGDISVFLGNTTIHSVRLRRNNRIVGMIDNLAGCSALTTIDLQSTQVTGNLAALGSCLNLTSIVIGATSVTGTVEDLVAAFNDAGRTSGSISILFNNTGVTYNGLPVTGSTLTWNGQNIVIS